MPDFPKVGGATAAEVAAAILVDPADKIEAHNIDGLISTRALDSTVAKSATALSNATWTDPKAGYLTGNVALDSTVAKEAGNVATVMAKTNIIGASVALEGGGNLATVMGKTNNIGASVALESAGNLAAVKTRTDLSLVAVTPTEVSILLDATDKTLVEITDVKVAEVEAWLDLTPMAGGDTIIVKYSRKAKVAGAYGIYAQETYTGIQTMPMVKLMGAKIYRDIKISAQQTAGGYKTLDIQVIRTVTV